MKARLLIAAFLLVLVCTVVAAETYQIQVRFTVRLRASYSLDSAVVGIALAGDVLQVVGRFNRWLKISRDGRHYWLADWVAHTRVDQASPKQTQSASDIDNCCFVDRQCHSDQEWENGYWAFQNGQCVAPAQTRDQTSAQPTGNESSQINNCCFAGWRCITDQEWENGYWAYQNNQCNAPAQSHSANGANCCLTGWNCVGDREWANGRWAYANNVCVHPAPHDTRPGEGPSCCFHGWHCTADYDWLAGRFHYADYGGQCGSPIQEIYEGVILEGSPTFIAKVKAALALIRRRSPEWYAYTITATRKIREKPSGGSSTLQHSINLSNNHVNAGAASAAGTLVHESCHQQRWLVWVWREYAVEWTAEEAVCDTVADMAMRRIAPGQRGLQFRIQEFLSLGLDFDLAASANREWERAKLILSRLR